MSDPQDQSGNPPVDSNAFQEWVTHTAEARDIEEDELLNQLVSAFWVLDEMNGLMLEDDPFGPTAGDSTIGSATGRRPTDESESEPDETHTRSTTGTPDDESETRTPDGESESAEARDRPSAPSDESTAQEIRDLRDSLHTQLEMVQAVGELRRQVNDISLNVEKQRTRQDDFTDRISDELTRLHSRMETIDSERSNGLDDELRDRFGRIDSRIDDLGSRLDEVAAGDGDIDAAIEDLESTQREFETWVDEEFDEIERLFERLIGTTDELEDRIESVEDDLNERAERDESGRKLAELRSDALRSGVDSGRCETCSTSIDLSLLDEPSCPSCSSEFSGVELDGSSWNPFSKPTIRTE